MKQKNNAGTRSCKPNLNNVKEPKVYLVGNKSDIYDNTVGSQQVEVSNQEGEEARISIGAEELHEVSAKTGEGVNTLFENIALALHDCDVGDNSDDHSFSLHKKKRNKKTADYYDDLNQTGVIDSNVNHCNMI